MPDGPSVELKRRFVVLLEHRRELLLVVGGLEVTHDRCVSNVLSYVREVLRHASFRNTAGTRAKASTRLAFAQRRLRAGRGCSAGRRRSAECSTLEGSRTSRRNGRGGGQAGVGATAALEPP